MTTNTGKPVWTFLEFVIERLMGPPEEETVPLTETRRLTTRTHSLRHDQGR
jgi:hypothetical protein